MYKPGKVRLEQASPKPIKPNCEFAGPHQPEACPPMPVVLRGIGAICVSASGAEPGLPD